MELKVNYISALNIPFLLIKVIGTLIYQSLIKYEISILKHKITNLMTNYKEKKVKKTNKNLILVKMVIARYYSHLNLSVQN